jgi:hypothetical protein
VGVDDAAGATGRARREAHRRGLVLVEERILPLVGIGGCEEFLVGLLDDEDVLDRPLGAERLEEREQRAVDDDSLVVRVRRDVARSPGWRPRLSVCRTKPPHGIPKYASWCW